MERYKVPPLQVKLKREAMTMNGYSTFPRAPRLELQSSYGFMSLTRHSLVRRGSYPSAELQSACSSAPVVWTDRSKFRTFLPLATLVNMAWSVTSHSPQQKGIIYWLTEPHIPSLICINVQQPSIKYQQVQFFSFSHEQCITAFVLNAILPDCRSTTFSLARHA